MKQEKEYNAFISYKRIDEKWTKWLQYKLEHYSFITSLNVRTYPPKIFAQLSAMLRTLPWSIGRKDR